MQCHRTIAITMASVVLTTWCWSLEATEPLPSFCFQFEIKDWAEAQDAWRFARQEFRWGFLESSDGRFHYVERRVGFGNPENPAVRVASVIEITQINTELTMHLTRQANKSQNVAIETPQAAQDFFNEFNATEFDELFVIYSASEYPTNKLLSTFPFLGVTESGYVPHNPASKRVGGFLELTTTAGEAKLNFRFDPSNNLVREYQAAYPKREEVEVDLFSGEETGNTKQYPAMIASGKLTEINNKEYLWTKVLEVENGRLLAKTETKVRELSFDGVPAFRMVYSPKEGQEIVLDSSQQIKAEWKNGQVVRTFDGKMIESVNDLQFESSGSNFLRSMLLLVLIAGAGAGVYTWCTRR